MSGCDSKEAALQADRGASSLITQNDTASTLTTPTLTSTTDWPLYGRDYNNQRFSPLTQINTQNIQQLKLAWRYQTGKKATFQTSPIIIDDVMYITTPFNDVIALKADSGEETWRYHHQLRQQKTCCGPSNRGPAVADGIVYTATIDSRLIALDQHTGEVLWDIDIQDTETNSNPRETLETLRGWAPFDQAKQVGSTGYSASMAPQVYDGKVFVGITGAGYGLHLEIQEDGKQKLSVGGFSKGGNGLRGFLVAYDAKNGEELWRWYSVPKQGWEGVWKQETAGGIPLNRDIEKEKRLFEHNKESWRYGGGSIWSTPAIDPELGLIYFGTGNPAPQFEDSSRPGDNLYTCSLVALDINTGKLQWFYQQTPHDRWGYDVASPPFLFDYQKQEKTNKREVNKGEASKRETIKAVGQASKSGWIFVHDAKTGELLVRSEPFVPQSNLFAPPTEAGTRIVPGPIGATSWSPVSLNPNTNIAYVSGTYQPSYLYSIKLKTTVEKQWDSYTYFKPADETDSGLLSALSLNTGKILWQTKVDDPMVGGSLATAGGILFTGEGKGQFNAYNEENGELIWHYRTRYGVNAPPITYEIEGKQYIAVAAGGNQVYGYKTGDSILVFALD